MLTPNDVYWVKNLEDLNLLKTTLDKGHSDIALDTETYVKPQLKSLLKDRDNSITFSPYISNIRLIQIGVAEQVELEPNPELSSLEKSFWVPKQKNFKCFLIDTHETPKEIIIQILNYINEKNLTIVGHELKFDISHLYVNYNWIPNRVFCTLVSSQLLGHATGSTSIGQLGRSLKNLCSDWLSRPNNEINLDKTEQKSDWSTTLTTSQIEYATLDTYYLIPLKILITRACQNLGIEKDLELEQAIVSAVALMELNGLRLDIDLYNKIIQLAKEELVELKLAIAEILKLPIQKKSLFGLNKNTKAVPLDETIFASPKRLKEALTNVGIVTKDTQTDTLKVILEALTNTEITSKSTKIEENSYKNNLENNQEEPDSDQLEESTVSDNSDVLTNNLQLNLTNKEKAELINNILRIKVLNKLIGTKYQRFVNPITHKIHPKFNQGRAQTGRFACTDPNLQALAKDGIFDREANHYYSLREIIQADGEWVTEGNITYWSGYLMCARDIDRQELVVAAYLSGDETLKKALESGEDLHTTHALLAWPELTEAEVKLPYKKLGNKKPRDKAKTIIYGLLYGQNPLVMAANMGLSEKEGEEFYKRLKTRYPKLFSWLDDIAEFGIKHKWVRYTKNAFVTRRRFLAGNAKGMADENTLARLSKNSPIQGISAAQAKNMLRCLFNYIKQNNLFDKVKVCGQIHDEFIFQFKGRLYLACSIKNYQNSKDKRFDEYIQYIPEFENPEIVQKIAEILTQAGEETIEYKLRVNTGATFAPYWAKE